MLGLEHEGLSIGVLRRIYDASTANRIAHDASIRKRSFDVLDEVDSRPHAHCQYHGVGGHEDRRFFTCPIFLGPNCISHISCSPRAA